MSARAETARLRNKFQVPFVYGYSGALEAHEVYHALIPANHLNREAIIKEVPICA